MIISELCTLLETTGLPVVYHSFKASKMEVQIPPYIVYFATKSNNSAADNKVYYKRNAYTAELYTDTKNTTIEQKLEDAFDRASIFYEKTETYLDTEEMYQISYEIEI